MWQGKVSSGGRARLPSPQPTGKGKEWKQRELEALEAPPEKEIYKVVVDDENGFCEVRFFRNDGWADWTNYALSIADAVNAVAGVFGHPNQEVLDIVTKDSLTSYGSLDLSSLEANLSLFHPCSLKVMFNFVGGNEAKGVRKCIMGMI